jgi:hypothetical protein
MVICMYISEYASPYMGNGYTLGGYDEGDNYYTYH